MNENISIIDDEIEGAKVRIAIPRIWNKGLLIHCHGHRREGIPLMADLNIEEESFSKFLNEGWIVSMTSYRREGVIVKDACFDVNNLRQYVSTKFGEPEVTLLEGRSMGGCIATHLAERFPFLYQGAVAIGAALGTNDKKDYYSFQYNPQFPIIFLTNLSETGAIENYIEKCDKQNEDHIVLPALWTISREGHNLVTEDERYNAINHLAYWIKFQTFITCRFIDQTIHKSNPKKQTNFHQDHPDSSIKFEEGNKSGTGKVKGITIQRSIIIDFQESDMKKLGWFQGKWFELNGKIKKEKVYYGSYPFAGVPFDSLISYHEPNNGYLIVCRFTYKYNDFAKEFNFEIGDDVKISERNYSISTKLKKQIY
eukprot:gene8319-143_t